MYNKVRGMREEWSDWEERSRSRGTVRVTESDSVGCLSLLSVSNFLLSWIPD